jgi:hypothetical protein
MLWFKTLLFSVLLSSSLCLASSPIIEIKTAFFRGGNLGTIEVPDQEAIRESSLEACQVNSSTWQCEPGIGILPRHHGTLPETFLVTSGSAHLWIRSFGQKTWQYTYIFSPEERFDYLEVVSSIHLPANTEYCLLVEKRRGLSLQQIKYEDVIDELPPAEFIENPVSIEDLVAATNRKMHEFSVGSWSSRTSFEYLDAAEPETIKAPLSYFRGVGLPRPKGSPPIPRSPLEPSTRSLETEKESFFGFFKVLMRAIIFGF